MTATAAMTRSSTRRLATAMAAMVAALAACVPAGVVNVLVPNNGYEVREGLAYGPAARQVLDVYVPTAAPDNAPVIVFIYGGGWDSGDRAYFRFVGEAFARLGYVVVIPDYRLYPEVRFPTFAQDSAGAVRWVRDNIAGMDGDADRIVLMGHSAGAHIAALLVTDRRYLQESGVAPESIRGFVGLAGPYAFNPLEYESTRPIFAPADDPAESKPIAFVTGDEPSMLLLHGADDDTVLPKNSIEMAERVNDAGGEARLIAYDGVGHIGLILAIAAPFREQDSVYGDITAFLAGLTDRPGSPGAAAQGTDGTAPLSR
ncbi:MAG: alpha/beta hydrolase [Rhodospirillales bacterium]|nr:alpha/beta hydrolase [Rhodospirillales bacterium]